MNKRQAKDFKKRLLTLRESISEEIRRLGEDSIKKSQRDATGDLSAYTFHMADVASDSYDREFSLDLVSGEQKVLYQVDEALKKIEEGTYGVCEACGEKISKERLKAIPYTKLCRKCQQNTEKKR